MSKPMFVKTRRYVDENRTYLAFCAGSILTSTVIYYLQGGNITLLKVTKENAEMLKKGGAIVYNLKHQTLTLIDIPAVEAAKALA